MLGLHMFIFSLTAIFGNLLLLFYNYRYRNYKFPNITASENINICINLAQAMQIRRHTLSIQNHALSPP